MTGIRRAFCDCCGVDFCGLSGAVAYPCSTVTSSDCPTTLAVSFTFAGIEYHSDCNYGVGSTDCQIIETLPAIDTVITVTQIETHKCYYTGTQAISGSWTTNPCTGSGIVKNYSDVLVKLRANAHLFGDAQLVGPCFDSSCDPNICAGICAEIFVRLDGGGAYPFAACWFSHCIDNCSVSVPCYNTYGGDTPNQLASWLWECDSPNHASACISGDGWSSSCSETHYSRTQSDAVFTVSIS